jgi:hypothetical protein
VGGCDGAVLARAVASGGATSPAGPGVSRADARQYVHGFEGVYLGGGGDCAPYSPPLSLLPPAASSISACGRARALVWVGGW